MKPTYEQLVAQSSKLADAVMTCVSKVEELQAQVKQLAAENAALKTTNEDRRMFIMNGVQLGYINVPTMETDPALETIRIAVSPQEPTPATDAYLSHLRNEARAEAIPDGYMLVPEKMYLEAGDIESICSQCGDGHENGYGDFTGAILWVGELADDDGKVKYGLNIASSECPEEGSVAIYEFAELREGKAGEVCNG